MRDLMLDILNRPEAHADPYVWGAVFLAHAALGAVCVAALWLIAGAWARVVLAISGYAVFEAWHLSRGGGLADGLADLAGFGLGAALASAAWQRRRYLLAGLVLALGFGLWRGVSRRTPQDEGPRDDR